jgi:hypothetical protein
MMEGVNSTMIYCENFCKCYSVLQHNIMTIETGAFPERKQSKNKQIKSLQCPVLPLRPNVVCCSISLHLPSVSSLSIMHSRLIFS